MDRIQLHPDDVEAISKRIADEMVDRKRAYWIDPEKHARDHHLVDRIRTERAEWDAFRKKVVQSATIWAVILVIGWVGVVVWHAVSDGIRAGGGGP